MISKVIDLIDNVEILKKICKEMIYEASSNEYDYERSKKEIKELKEENEKLKKFLDSKDNKGQPLKVSIFSNINS